jgi:serine/threonine-protein phosphatase 5
MTDSAVSAESIKNEGNVAFGQGRYGLAIELYSSAIQLAPSAALYSNRSYAHLKQESYGSAIADADAALLLDPSYVKALYRRGTALLALSKYKLARADFKQVVAMKPGDKDALLKLSEADKAVKREAFEEAIAIEATKPVSEKVRLEVDNYIVEPSYNGPVLDIVQDVSITPMELSEDDTKVNSYGISLSFVKSLMSHFHSQRLLHKKYAYEILLRSIKHLKSLPPLLQIDIPHTANHFNICGDTHGQYYDTLNIFDEKVAGLPSPKNPYLFNGDFVDRGSFSVENIFVLLSWMLLYPSCVYLLRGNHETKNMNKMYGFEGEVKEKYDATMFDLFSELFQALPICAVINKKVFVTHGGLFQRDDVMIAELAKIDRFREPGDSGLMSELLWSDPQLFVGRGPSKRGLGMSFGPDVTANFLKMNNLSLVVRSHEVMEEGYQVMHDGKLITVFSAPNYCDEMKNKGGVVRIDATTNNPSFIVFDAVPHPPIKPMAYAGNMGRMFGF